MPTTTSQLDDRSTSPQGPLAYTLTPTPSSISFPIFWEKPDQPIATIGSVAPVEVLFGYKARNPDAVAQIKSYLEIGYEFLKRNTLKKSYKFSRSVERSTSAARILKLLDDLFLNIQAVLNGDDSDEFIALAPLPRIIIQISLALRSLRAEVRDALIVNGLPVPELPIWGATNCLDEWWSAQDFGILSVCYRHEVELFLSNLALHIPKNNSSEASVVTETSSSHTQSLTTAPTPPPVEESITMGLAKQKQAHRRPHASLPAPATLSKAPRFKELLSTTRGVNKPLHSSMYAPEEDDSSSDDASSPHVTFHSNATKPSKSFSTKSSISSDHYKPSGYHFDMKIKQDSVPEWDGNADTLARWIIKVRALAQKSESIHQELGKVIPRRFTGAAEAWYYSIPERDRCEMEESWDTMRAGISDYWMNNDWMSKQKLKATRAKFQEAGYSHELPSEFVIRKRELVSLLWDYSDTELIQLVMESVPSTWHSILHTGFMKTFTQFQNAVKYYEETLLKMGGSNFNEY